MLACRVTALRLPQIRGKQVQKRKSVATTRHGHQISATRAIFRWDADRAGMPACGKNQPSTPRPMHRLGPE
jgi:hypothetical protein